MSRATTRDWLLRRQRDKLNGDQYVDVSRLGSINGKPKLVENLNNRNERLHRERAAIRRQQRLSRRKNR